MADKSPLEKMLDSAFEKVLSVLSPNKASAEVIPLDEPSKRYALELQSGKHGATAKDAYDSAHALRDSVEVRSGGSTWAKTAKNTNKSVEFLNQSNLLGVFDRDPERRSPFGSTYSIALNPSLDRYEQNRMIRNPPARTLAHELGHFLSLQSGVPMAQFDEDVADFLAGEAVPKFAADKARLADVRSRVAKLPRLTAGEVGARIGAVMSLMRHPNQ